LYGYIFTSAAMFSHFCKLRDLILVAIEKN
jgi:hypothetical protein